VPTPPYAQRRVDTPNQTPTLQDIANVTGFGRTTISLALRGHPRIPAATRETIREAAQRLGYRSNPLVAALMTQTRDKRRVHRERIALVTRLNQAISRMGSPYHHLVYKGILAQAAEHGFDIEEFHYDVGAPMSDRRLSQVLVARGIHGVLFFPGNPKVGDVFPALEWENFSTVVIGYGMRRLELHQVSSDYTYDMDLALERVSAHGDQRVGLVIPPLLEELTDRSWTARYLVYQSALPASRRLPLLMMKGHGMELDRVVFMDWLRRARPGTIITSSSNEIARWLREEERRVPEDVKIIHLLKREESPFAGIDPQTVEVGAAAIQLLISLLQTNQRGRPKFPRAITIKGLWSAGTSYPE
jgi:LacI family transcriptional regulator